MLAQELLQRIELNPEFFQGKPTLRGRRMAVEHVLSLLAAGDTAADILAHYPNLELADIQACILYAYRLVARETIEPFPAGHAA